MHCTGASNSEQVPGLRACSALRPLAGGLASAGPSGPGGRTPAALRGHSGSDSERSLEVHGGGDCPSPDSRVPMAAGGCGPYLGSPTLEEPHVPEASAPQTPELDDRTPDLPLNQDGCASMPNAQAITLQVDMAMALEPVDLAEQYGQSYLCLLQTAFAVGKMDLIPGLPLFLIEGWIHGLLSKSLSKKSQNALLLGKNEPCSAKSWTDIQSTFILVTAKLTALGISFPGNLHLVLVLRPTSFLQRTFTDIGFRFSQEDFMLKLPVVMLSSVSDLLTYIDDKQLTPELGGTLQYCHSEWIIFRNAIENFALTVKEMAQMLQAFGTELAETELPDDIPSIEEIIAIRAERYHLLKNDITAVTKEGKILLANLEVPDTEESISSRLEHHEQISGDWQTVNKLLTQVHDMEIAFDEFWEKHQLKTEQYLQLWKFEQDFQELVREVELLINQQAELADVTGNIAQIKQKIKELEHLDENLQDLLAKAQFVILHGHRLASNHHYALDLICQRCNELRYLSDILVNEIKGKRIQLSRTFKMHKLLLQQIQIQTVQLKLESIQTVFGSQQGGFKNLKDEHVRPIQFVLPASNKVIRSKTPFYSPKPGKKTWKQNQSNLKIEVVHDSLEKRSAGPSSTLSNANTLDILKNHVLNELIQTEKIYVRELFTVLLGYKSEMDNPEMFALMPPLLRNKKDVLFGNMAEIYEFHSNLFMSSLENCTDAPERVGLCFLERRTDFEMYAKYCQNKPKSEAVWKKYSECAFFQECQRKLKHRLGLDSYLLKPVQRLTKYQLLLKELLKYSKDCEGSGQLKEALDTMLDLLKSVNDSMHQIAINGYVGNLNDLGKMVMQGAFSVWIGHKKGATKMKDFARFKPMQRHLFLYEKAIVFCKMRLESGEGSSRYPSYSYKHSLKMDEVGITEYVKGDNRKFEIWYAGKEEIYIVQASNIDVKMIWLKEIRSILLKQQELMTVKERQQYNQLTEQNQLSSQRNDERQQGALIGAEGTGSEHTNTVVGAGEEIVTVQAEANTVQTTEISERPEAWSNNYFSSSCVDNEEERPLMVSSDILK
ncbi:PREDICTED: proto-oncogene DBL [Miniopterus natalensis]|uniref:proto-oncogene DBL n=1 Tax=Miniopterus natalensis TaxID=291302 RepID=UPI0007A6C000|nr:PREDICTED: proto-oncogene DBL [Miniopterus natalensis]